MRATRPTPQVLLDEDPFAGTAYRAVARLGQGAMGTVFAVEHRELGRQFAAKLMHESIAAVPQLVDRVRLEAQALGRLSHPHIVSVTGFEATRDGRPFLVMELLQGRSLAEELGCRGRLPIGEAVSFACQLLSALEAAHSLGLVHRDVKPGNIFLAEVRGRGRSLKLFDFGIARVLPRAPAGAPPPLAVPTVTGQFIGTPRFTSPEGAWGARVDTPADLYGAALVLYAMLAGRGPFDHFEGDDAVRGAHAQWRPAPPSQYAADPIPAELDSIVLRALEKDPALRFGTAADFRRALEEVSELIARPQGWLQTTVFERRALAEPDSSAPEVEARAGSARPPPARAADPARAAPRNSISAVPKAPARDGRPSQLAPRSLRSRIVVSTLFVSGIVIAALFVVGITAALRALR